MNQTQDEREQRPAKRRCYKSSSNSYGLYHVQISTDSNFGATLPNASVLSGTSTLTGGATTYAGLLSGATYFVRTRTLWNGQQQSLEQNASGYVNLSTATLPVLPTLTVSSADVNSLTVVIGSGANNNNCSCWNKTYHYRVLRGGASVAKALFQAAAFGAAEAAPFQSETKGPSTRREARAPRSG